MFLGYQTDSSPSLPTALEKPETLTEELSASDRDDDLDRDSGSKVSQVTF